MGMHLRLVLRRGLVASALGLVFLSGCGDEDVSSELINAFGGACSPVGVWTQSALNQNKALVQTLSNLENDDKCKPYLSSISTVQRAVSQASLLLKDDQFMRYRADEEQLQDLTLALQSPPSDPKLASALQDQLILTKVSLYQSRAMARASQTVAEKDRYGRSTADLAQYLQTVMSAQQAGGLKACLREHPEAAVGIASNLLALGGSFVSPVYGVGFAVVGEMLSIGVNAVAGKAKDNAIWQAHQATLPLALTCGLESMTEHYCDAVDSLELLELKKNSIQNGGEGQPAPIWRGIDLLSTSMPVLNSWLSKVRNGITPTDMPLANKQNSVLAKMSMVDQVRNSVFASLSENQQVYNDSPETQKTNVMVTTIMNQVYQVMGMSSSVSAGTPFTELTTDPKNYACWFILGMVTDEKCMKANPANLQEMPEDYIRRILSSNKLDFPLLFSHWDEIYKAVKGKVEAEFNRTITANPSSLIADAYESAPSSDSPHEVLTKLVDYFNDLKKTGGVGNPAYQSHLDETIQLIEKVLTSLDPSSLLPNNPSAKDIDPSIRRIGNVFTLLELNRGIGIFADRISRIVQWDLNSKVKTGQFPKEISEILRLAGTEFKDRLVQSGQGTSDGAMNDDLNRAKHVGEGNIAAFRSAFKEDFGRAVQYLKKAAIEAGEPMRGSNRANGQVLGHLCTLILATGNQWPDGFDPSICMQAYLDPLYGGPNSPAFSIEVAKLAKALEGKPSTFRFCAYHRYLRAERLAELPSVYGRKDQKTSLMNMSSGWTNFNLMEMMAN